MNGVSAILLAAGESTRMGHPKALLDWHGQTLLQYQVEALLEAGYGEVVVVLGHQAPKLRPLVPRHPHVRTVVNRRYRSGKTSSIHSGLRHVDPEAAGVLIVGVDQPHMMETLRALLQAFLAQRPLIATPAYQGRSGHPPLFRACLFAELMDITEETQGLRAVVERHRDRRLLVKVGSPLVCLDLNTPQDYQKALRLVAL